MNYLISFIVVSYFRIISRRITIMIDDDLDKKVRVIQAKQIQKTNSSVSYSKTINEILRKHLK